MTDVDRVRDAERRVREDLQRTLVPPPTPASLYAAVDRLALDPPSQERVPGRWFDAIGRPRTLRAVLGAAAVIALAVGLLALLQVRGRNQVATTPLPTLPAVVGPALPSAAAKPTRLDSGAWLDASTAWSVDQAQNLRISEDGGQTWSEARPVPQNGDLGLDMVDAAHGYVGWALRHTNSWDVGLYRSSNGGRTWDLPQVVAGTLDMRGTEQANLLAELHFVDPLHGVFLATSQDLATAASAAPDRECIAFTTDTGGVQWTNVPSAPCLGTRVLWASRELGVISGRSPSTLNVTQDGGRTWVTAPAPSVEGATTFTPMLLARSTDGTTLRLLGSSFGDTATIPPLTVYESRDAGQSWEPAYVPAGLPSINTGLAWALDGEHWLAASEVETLGGMDLLESWDAGRTWTPVSHAAVEPGSMQWFDRLHGTLQGVPIACNGSACGGDGTILLTNDGGQSWHQVPF